MPHPPPPSAGSDRPAAPADPPRLDGPDGLILDLFRVVVAFDDRLVVDRLAQRCPRPQEAAARMADLVSDADLIRGRTPLAALHARLAADCGLDASLPEFEAMWAAPYAEPMPGMRPLLRHLLQHGAGRCRLVLLSNVDAFHWPTVRACVPELERFHARVLSFEQGVAKGNAEQVPVDGRASIGDGMQGARRSHTRRYGEHLQRRRPPQTRMRTPRGTCSALPRPEAQAFERAIAASGCATARCWFVDDKAENLDAAAALGLAGHLFRDTLDLTAALRRRGLLDDALA